MENYKLQYTRLANIDIADINIYIKNELLNQKAANRILHMILDKINITLPGNPYGGKKYFPKSELKYNYRYLIVGNYLIFYLVDDERKIVIVSRVLDGRTDYEKELE